MKRIHLRGKRGNGLVSIIDDDYFESISKTKWYLSTDGYACNRLGKFMHNYIHKRTVGMHTDHINGNKLDNRKKNLRTVTPSQNAVNSKIQKNNKSGYKGVSWKKRKNRKSGIWSSYIRVNGKYIFIGEFHKKTDAINAFRTSALKYHGEYYRFK